jgi:predicted GNAT family acetyltransferase
MTDLLERPVWGALTTSHTALAEGGVLARRYPRAVTSLAAIRNEDTENLAALASLMSSGETAILLQPARLAPVASLERVMEADVVQMVATASLPEVTDPRVEPLTEADAPTMLDLATLTKPGPFTLKALSLGRFWGVKRDGRLVAMAGERMRVPGFTELSGLCTHPDVRGQGLGALMLRFVAGRICATGERPFLHAYASNAAAIGLYEATGFAVRRMLVASAVTRR